MCMFLALGFSFSASDMFESRYLPTAIKTIKNYKSSAQQQHFAVQPGFAAWELQIPWVCRWEVVPLGWDSKNCAQDVVWQAGEEIEAWDKNSKIHFSIFQKWPKHLDNWPLSAKTTFQITQTLSPLRMPLHQHFSSNRNAHWSKSPRCQHSPPDSPCLLWSFTLQSMNSSAQGSKDLHTAVVNRARLALAWASCSLL